MSENKPQARLHAGSLAPDFALTNTQAQTVHLADLWQNGPTVLTFLRHFG